MPEAFFASLIFFFAYWLNFHFDLLLSDACVLYFGTLDLRFSGNVKNFTKIVQVTYVEMYELGI